MTFTFTMPFFGLAIQNEAEQRLTEFCQENKPIIANVYVAYVSYVHRKRMFPRDDFTSGHHPDGIYENKIDYILCSQRWRSFIQSAKTRPGADYASDHELLIDKFRLKLKKVGQTTRPFMYELNQILYDYSVEVRIYSRD